MKQYYAIVNGAFQPIDVDVECGPLLAALIKNGAAFIDGSEIVGRAADGTEVNLGHTSDYAAVERYLAARPTPAQW